MVTQVERQRGEEVRGKETKGQRRREKGKEQSRATELMLALEFSQKKCVLNATVDHIISTGNLTNSNNNNNNSIRLLLLLLLRHGKTTIKYFLH